MRVGKWQCRDVGATLVVALGVKMSMNDRRLPNEAEILQMLEEADRNGRYVAAHYRELLQQYPNRWIAVYEEKVVAVSRSHKALLKQLDKLGCRRNGSVTQFLDTDPPQCINHHEMDRVVAWGLDC